MVDSESIIIAIVLYGVPGRAIESVKVVLSEAFKVKTDGILELIVCYFSVCVLSEFVQDILLG